MKLEKGITILCNSYNEFRICCKHFNIVDVQPPFWNGVFSIFFWTSEKNDISGKPIIYDKDNNMYGWCDDCSTCNRSCEYKNNERITYSEYKNMIRINKLNRILKNEK